MKRLWCWLLVLAMTTVLCVVPALAQEVPELTYLRWDNDPFTEAEWAEIEAKIGAKVNLIVVPFDEYYTKLNTLIAAKETPDLFQISEYLAVEWGEKGLSQDLVPL
ncbi:MAG: extracellular solute-binding protein, partial [Peptococcales bacterium]